MIVKVKYKTLKLKSIKEIYDNTQNKDILTIESIIFI